MVRDPNRLVWPPTRSDVFSVVCLGVLVYASVERQWALVGVALLVALFAVVLPRMRGPFELGGPRLRFKGELVDPQAERELNRPPARAEPPAD